MISDILTIPSAPTWSWASVDGPVSYKKTTPFMSSAEKLVKYIGGRIITATDDHFGQVLSGYIDLRGPLTRCSTTMFQKLRASIDKPRIILNIPNSTIVGLVI